MNRAHVYSTTYKMPKVSYEPLIYNRDRFNAIDGPSYYITLAGLKQYEKSATDDNYKANLCANIINKALELVWFLNNHEVNRDMLIDMTREELQPLKIHILQAIECFKYAVAQGYPVKHYDDASNLRYCSLASIFALYFINIPETREFIRYYYGLFPNLKDDRELVRKLPCMLMYNCTRFGEFNHDMFRFLINIFRTLDISFDYTYYEEIINTVNDDYDPEDGTRPDEHMLELYSQYFQAGINHGFKINDKQVCALYQLIPCKLYLDIREFDKNIYYYKRLYRDMISNYNEWRRLERTDIITASRTKANFITRENIEQNGDTLVNINLATMANNIADFC